MLTVANSTISGNSAVITDGGGMICDCDGTVSNSTFQGNTAQGAGGGIINGGTLTVSNSTFQGNDSFSTGGGIDNRGALTISYSTFSGNVAHANASPGGGINNNGTSLTVSSSVFLSNNGPLASIASSCAGAITDGGYNISSDATCGFTAPSSLSSTDPMLEADRRQRRADPDDGPVP